MITTLSLSNYDTHFQMPPQATLLYDLISSSPLSASKDFVPSWGSAVAVLLTLTPMICIPIFILITAVQVTQIYKVSDLIHKAPV